MKLQDLKARVLDQWEFSHECNSALPAEDFKSAIRKYGDLRKKATWVKAYATLKATNTYDSCLDAYKIITISFNSEWWAAETREYLTEVFDAFLTIPGAIDLIRTGLEQLFSDYCTPDEREHTDGFLKLVQGATERIGLPTGFVRGFPRLNAAQAS
jgi:hypothetical protein